MTRAEEAARKVYPIETRDNDGIVNDIGHPQWIRDYFIEGYEQAEKDTIRRIAEEIERRLQILKPHGGQGMIVTEILRNHYKGLLSFIGTTETDEKEIDLEKEIVEASKRYPEVSFAKLSRIAKRFFELGKNAK